MPNCLVIISGAFNTFNIYEMYTQMANQNMSAGRAFIEVCEKVYRKPNKYGALSHVKDYHNMKYKTS